MYGELMELMVNSHYAEPVVHEHFQVHRDCFGRFNGLNTSSLYSFLIKEAGRLCDSYASDLFYDLKTLDEALADDTSILFDQCEYRWVIGIRDMGCDHDSLIMSRIKDHTYKAAYRKMYYLEVISEDIGYFNLDLYEVSLSSLDACIRRREKAL